MPAKKNIFAIAYSRCALLIALCSIPLVFTSGVANAGDLNIDTGNVQMSLGQNGVFIRNAPVFPVRINDNFNNNHNDYHRIRTNRATRVLKCRNVNQRRHSLRGGSRVFTSATTTVCN